MNKLVSSKVGDSPLPATTEWRVNLLHNEMFTSIYEVTSSEVPCTLIKVPETSIIVADINDFTFFKQFNVSYVQT
ncbi:hypothetical protein AHF37_04629 [Paragonimus kellicotti]|nr:hypothetical protein AHF37_04629 [Paragonimus kellicotti]